MVVGSRSGLKDGVKVQPREVSLTGNAASKLYRTAMSRFAIHTPYLIVVLCLIIAILGGVARSANAGGYVPGNEYSGCCGGDFLFGNAARANRRRHHLPSGTLLYDG